MDCVLNNVVRMLNCLNLMVLLWLRGEGLSLRKIFTEVVRVRQRGMIATTKCQTIKTGYT